MDAVRDAMLASLSAQRRHVLGIVEGLTDADMRNPVVPSGWSCVGLVQHLAIDVERFWFRAVMANEQVAWSSLEQLEHSAWQVVDSLSPEHVVELYRRHRAGRSARKVPDRAVRLVSPR